MQGLKPSQLAALGRLFNRRFPASEVYSVDQARELALLSRAIGRQIGLLIDRRGHVRTVIAGEAGGLLIPELPRLRPGRLRGLRLLHTHLGPEGLSEEDLMDLLFLRLDAIIALCVNPAGEPVSWQGACLSAPGRVSASTGLPPDSPPDAPPDAAPVPPRGSDAPYEVDQPRPWDRTSADFAARAQALEEELLRSAQGHALPASAPGLTSGSGARMADKAARARSARSRASALHDPVCDATPRALLVSVAAQPQLIQARHLDELAELARTAGVEVVGRLIQRVARPNPRSILGKGKLAELEVAALRGNADLLIFDGELAPAQLHNLADITERKVMDRTQLILDIFAQHAATRAGRLQVELAQLRYALPRLTGSNRALDRLMGGIGGRGPGETRLESDRRKVRTRMARLNREIETLRRQRGLARSRRARRNLPMAALVGYTNAGKSTLLNTLTRSEVRAENRLFATLDPAARRLRFPSEQELVLADTVGFIRNLPRELMEAFRATLEELAAADFLVHVADAAHPDLLQQVSAVETILEELGLDAAPRVLVLNKWDQVDAAAGSTLLEAFPDAIPVSALTGLGLTALRDWLCGQMAVRAALARSSVAGSVPGGDDGECGCPDTGLCPERLQ